MRTEHVAAAVAVERMWIWGRAGYSATELATMSHTVMSGGTVTYDTYDAFGQYAGRTTIEPEDFPVTLVTETTQD